MSKNKFEISIVCSLYNEEAVLPEFYKRVTTVMQKDNIDYQIIFVDDGSFDQSYELLKKFKKDHSERIKIIKFARNFGHQRAITAGIKNANGQAVVVLDCDLQDPPEMILTFIKKWREGNEIVYGVRTERQGETFFKKFTAKVFYKLIRLATHIDIPENVGDFYLLDKRVVTILNQMGEQHRFVRGMIAWVGFKRIGINYIRQARLAGKTKYSFWKMVKFAFDAATSFSFLPLRVISFIGFGISFCSFLGLSLIVYLKIFTDTTITGWSSLMVVILFIGGIQLLAMGLIGEYIARIGDDVKKRPLYVIHECLD